MCNQDRYDEDILYGKLFDHYVGNGYPRVSVFFEPKNNECVKTECIDEYLVGLIDGYINFELKEELDKYLMEVLEDEWFMQWPLVRWAYASRLRTGRGCRKKEKKAIEILQQLAKEGYSGALFDIGWCYRFGEYFEFDYEKGICLWIEASKRGCRAAGARLKTDYEIKMYKQLGDDIKLFFLHEIMMICVREKGLQIKNNVIDISSLDDIEIKELKKINYERKKILKSVSKNYNMRKLTSLFWDYDEGPYKIDF